MSWSSRPPFHPPDPDPAPPPPIPLNYFHRPPPPRFRTRRLLNAAALLGGSLAVTVAGTWAVLRLGADPRFTLLSALIAPMVFAVGLMGLIHATDLIRAVLRKPPSAGG